mmetsp:Transcript_115720/g.373906  ORF Transcript_115720/g.373906 Transcript_115720/m.373906 type:complete len:104 (-) Transcript_115720:61-372(-)
MGGSTPNCSGGVASTCSWQWAAPRWSSVLATELRRGQRNSPAQADGQRQHEQSSDREAPAAWPACQGSRAVQAAAAVLRQREPVGAESRCVGALWGAARPPAW